MDEEQRQLVLESFGMTVRLGDVQRRIFPERSTFRSVYFRLSTGAHGARRLHTCSRPPIYLGQPARQRDLTHEDRRVDGDLDISMLLNSSKWSNVPDLV